MEIKEVTKENVKCSQFGCINCLWHGIECITQANFKPKVYDNKPTCENYTYYD